ncbi:MAG: hypothetical protein R3190_09590, partial [Thermoanaerobaculia bacterium]|nr:hypothetical protein [Thermoanaerobaculia bacterium]
MTSDQLVVSRGAEDRVVIQFTGDWDMAGGIPSTEAVERQLAAAPRPASVAFDGSLLGRWDSSLLVT